jgi:hypothetical protein
MKTIRNLLVLVEEVLLQADDVLALVVVDQTHRLETLRERSTDNQSCAKLLNYRRLIVEYCNENFQGSNYDHQITKKAVLRIRIRIHRIPMFLGLQDPDPDPSII